MTEGSFVITTNQLVLAALAVAVVVVSFFCLRECARLVQAYWIAWQNFKRAARDASDDDEGTDSGEEDGPLSGDEDEYEDEKPSRHRRRPSSSTKPTTHRRK